MDPNANLMEQLELAKSIQNDYDKESLINEHDAARLAELVIALNMWIINKGTLPKRWRND